MISKLKCSRCWLPFACAVATLTVGFSALAQQPYPSRAIEFIVPFGPGGGADQLARKSGKLLESILKVSVPVLNVPGATGATGVAKLVSAAPDGYSMAIYIADTHALLATSEPPYGMDDITPVARMISAPSYLFVKSDGPIKNWADFEKAAKAKPGALKVATVGFGSVDDMTLTFLEGKGIKLNQVPYPKPSERYVSVLGGHVDVLYEQAGDVASFLKNKQMLPIVVFGDKRAADFPNVPASKELGYDIGLPQFRSVVVHGKTDPKTIKALSDAFGKVAQTAEYKEFLKEQFAAEDSYMPADQARKFMRGELETMKKLAGTKKK
jgi:tripartite-type tricarboxylate transporter receptor subunit TctC